MTSDPAECIVAGIYMDRSLNEFTLACVGYIQHEQAKFAPDTDLIALLCDAVRLTREMAVMADRPALCYPPRRHDHARLL